MWSALAKKNAVFNPSEQSLTPTPWYYVAQDHDPYELIEIRTDGDGNHYALDDILNDLTE